MGALGLVYLAALGAGAGIVPVVLRYRNYGRLGMLLYPLAHLLGRDLNDVRIGQAQLGPFAHALAVHHGEVLGVLVKVLVRAEQRVKRMHEREVLYLASLMRVHYGHLAVAAVVRRPFAVQRVAAEEGFAVVQRGHVAHGDFVRHFQLQRKRHLLYRGRVPAAAAEPFKKIIHAVQRAARTAARDNDVLAHGADDEAFIAHVLGSEVYAELVLYIVGTAHDYGRFGLRQGNQRKVRARELP